MDSEKQKARAEWNFIVTFIKLFQPDKVEYDKIDGEYWVNNGTTCIDMYDVYKHISRMNSTLHGRGIKRD